MCLFESEVCRERGDMLYNTSVCLSVAVCVYSLHVHLMPWHYRWIPSLNVVLVAFFFVIAVRATIEYKYWNKMIIYFIMLPQAYSPFNLHCVPYDGRTGFR